MECFTESKVEPDERTLFHVLIIGCLMRGGHCWDWRCYRGIVIVMAALEIIRGAENAPIEPLKGKCVAVLGYGNQGRAHALNLRDSGLSVVIGSRGGRAKKEGFPSYSIAEAAMRGDLVIVALPDEVQPEVYEGHIAPNLRPGAILGLLHGFSIHYGQIDPSGELGVVMIAPKGPGATLRDRFMRGLGIPCLYALHQDSPSQNARQIALAWANGIGCARAGIICTSFAHETETDLFGEQTVLCGGLTSLILAAFETLVGKGYPPELAYLECCHEVKQIADLVYERGLAGMMSAISNTAEFGAHTAGPAVVDEHVRFTMGTVLDRIRSGEFARTMRDDYAAGFSWFEKQREALRRHAIESAGETIRSLMPRVESSDDD